MILLKTLFITNNIITNAYIKLKSYFQATHAANLFKVKHRVLWRIIMAHTRWTIFLLHGVFTNGG